MSASIDPNKAYLEQVSGEVTAVFSWARLPDPEDPYRQVGEERVMYICATYRRGTKHSPGAPVYVIREADAHLYATKDGVALPALDRAAKRASIALGFGTDSSALKIHKLILDGLVDLCSMPSAPPIDFHLGSYGSLVMKEDGKPFASEDIKLEKQGVTYG